MHDPSSRACASYFLEDYRARQAGAVATDAADALAHAGGIPPMSDAQYDRHVENLADRIQETVERYLQEIDETAQARPKRKGK